MFVDISHIVFLKLLYLFMIILCKTLLPSDKVHAKPADIGKTIKLKPTTGRVIDVDVAPMITTVCTDSRIVFRVL